MMKNDRDKTEGNIVEYFKADIAGKHVEIECIHRYVFNMSRDYLAKFDHADYVIAVNQDEIDQERDNSAKQDKLEGRSPKAYSDDYLEFLALYRKLADALLGSGILLFHGAAVAAEGKCYLFMAPSGTGKTTHIRKWLDMHHECIVVNGDKPLIDMNKLLVYGTPWCGKERLNTNTSVPLGGMVFLERGEKNEIERISFSQALPLLMQQCHIPSVSNSIVKVVQLMNNLQDIPCWRLRCNLDDEAGEVSYNALVRGDNK